MALKVSQDNKTTSSSSSRIPDGTYLTRIAQIIDMGEQLQTDFATGEAKEWKDGSPMYKPEIMITFEFPSERIELDGESRPRWLSKTYIASLHEKSGLYALIKSADPKANPKVYDVASLINKPVMVTVGSTSSNKPKVVNVVGVPNGITVPPLENDPKVFDLSNPDMELLNTLPDWIKEKILSSPSAKSLASSSEEDFSDDVPF